MKKFFALSLLILLGYYCNAAALPNQNETYRVKIDLVDNFHDFSTATKTCGTTLYNAEKNTIFSVIKVLTPQNMAIVEVIRAFKGINQVSVGSTYCISVDDIDSYCEKFDPTDSGILSIPFKLRFSPTTFTPGGTIGYYIGHKYEGRTTATLLGFAGLTLISLNDINSETPDSRLGLTIGGGYVWKLKTDTDFQIGIITGIDIFKGADQWPYKYWPWVSLSIGFTFTKSTISPGQANNLQ